MNSPNPIPFSVNRTSKVPDIFISEAVRHKELNYCNIYGFGTFNSAVIEDAKGNTIELKGPVDAILINGRLKKADKSVDIELRCIFATTTFNGQVVTGGRLIDGEASQLEITFTPLDIADGDFTTVNNTVEHSANHSPMATMTPKQAASDKWSRAVEVSQKTQKIFSNPNDDNDEALPRQGDIVDHRQFGECKVIKISDDHISLQKPNGRIVQLGLKILKFYIDDTKNGKNIWKLQVRK
ncbi:MAG: hypothetical protein JXR91_16320 [Deltaproteobacteria bacterium]|nr:hypothetical protein [Deltaproteobacteria bacterium]